MQGCVVVIPAYKPTAVLVKLIQALQVDWVSKIVCVDDGSGVGYAKIFQLLSTMDKVCILKHAVNMGKGRALKTAFNYILNELSEIELVITADADGQHTVDAIKRVYEAYHGEQEIILGSREFVKISGENKIPLRSRLGNIATKLVFNFLCNIKVSDTQTGLRGISATMLPGLLKVDGEGYEYETNCLLWCKDCQAGLKEVGIETIYEYNNASSHFNPLRDSLKIYLVIFKYTCSSMLSVVLDYVVFFLLTSYTYNVFILTYAGRVCASVVNFVMNKKVVFKAEGKNLIQVVKYFLLVILSGTISALSLSVFRVFIDNLLAAKVIVEVILFFFNFYIQKNVVFVKEGSK